MVKITQTLRQPFLVFVVHFPVTDFMFCQNPDELSILPSLSNTETLAGASAGTKQEDGGKFGTARIVIFSVQFACVGICRHFLVCGLFCEASVRAWENKLG